MKQEKPDSMLCCETRVFDEGKKCPDLDDSITLKPKCNKYGKALSWTISGKLLKCEECSAEG